MSGWKRAGRNLFDPTSGILVGFIDLNGNEQLGFSSAIASYSITPASISNQTTTKTTALTPQGIRYFDCVYSKVSGTPTGTKLYVVFNALNDTDAVAKLASDATRQTYVIGQTRNPFEFALGAEVTRIDFASDAATEAGVTLAAYNVGVALS